MQPESPEPHPYKLRLIELKDFKSIAHAKVNFHPLTVIVGANSSGKSSLIQAVLALSQVVRYGESTDRFPLNGELIRLGTFKETKNFKSPKSDSPFQMSAIVRDSDQIVEWSLDLISDDDVYSGTARIESLRFKLSKERFECDDGIDIEEIPQLINDLYLPNLEFMTNSSAKNSAHFLISEPEWWDIGGYISPFWDKTESHSCDSVVIVGGIPQSVHTNRKIVDSYARGWWDRALLECMGDTSVLAFSDKYEPYARIKQEAIAKGFLDESAILSSEPSKAAVKYAEAHIRNMHSLFTGKAREVHTLWSSLSDSGSREDRYNDLVKDQGQVEAIVRDEFSALSEHDRWNIALSMVQLGFAEFRNQLVKQFIGEPWADETVLDKSERSLSSLPGSWFVAQLFKESIKYLGPLRANPRPLHDYVSSKPDLGVNGEYTAAVLHTQANQEVLLHKVDGLSERTNLASALAYWMEKFNMADSLQVEDRGRLGFDLRISPLSIDKFVDLTSVGVGVSQVLPVILLCLLAEPGELVILEQPELHLHPALQHKLADFLLECTRSGRQILVETHSEHLINRLRRRVAEDDSDETESLVGLLFAEQHDGQTTFYGSKINAYGGLSQDWPDGFLDLGAREAQSLVRSSVYKHRRRQNRDEPLSDERKNGDER